MNSISIIQHPENINMINTQETLCAHECTKLKIYYLDLLKQVDLSVRLSEQDKVGQIQFLLKQWANEIEVLAEPFKITIDSNGYNGN